ncbi:MAG: hypothetical protein WBG71_11845 [Leeuwenhoekiella sp.]
MKAVIQIVLWIVILGLGYLLFNSVYGEVKFNEMKVVRYRKAIDKLKDIRSSQQAYKQVTGRYAGNYEQLVRFVDTADFVLTTRKDSTVLDEELTKAFRVDKYKEIIVVDTIGYRSVKDSLFGDTGRYKTMMKVPVEGIDEEFEMETSRIMKNEQMEPVFEAKVSKDVLFHDQPKDYIMKEKQVISVDGVNGSYLSIGSLNEVTTKGNWPKSYADDEQ